jgi:hypothetical protein
MAVLMGMEAPLGRVGLFLFGIGDSYGENPKKDGAVESHPSATGALGEAPASVFGLRALRDGLSPVRRAGTPAAPSSL